MTESRPHHRLRARASPTASPASCPSSRRTPGVIHIDIDPAEIGKIREVQVPIVGDLKGVLSGVERGREEVGRHSRITQARGSTQMSRMARSASRSITATVGRGSAARSCPSWCMQKLSRKLDPENSVVVTEVGQHQMWAAQFIDRDVPAHVLVLWRPWHHGIRLPGGHRRGVSGCPTSRSSASPATGRSR